MVISRMLFSIEDDCKGCPPHSHCLRGICICVPGYYFDGHHCVGKYVIQVFVTTKESFRF